jgi:hypothetical protein
VTAERPEKKIAGREVQAGEKDIKPSASELEP